MTRNVVEEIKQKVSLKEFIQSRGVELNERGWGLCPLHEETKPSFHVEERGKDSFFYCFGCNQGGDIYSFVMLNDGVGFGEALMRVAIYAGIDIGAYSKSGDLSKSVQDRLRREKNFAVLDAAANFYQEQLTDEARGYLYERGLTDETIMKFRIGFAPSNLGQFVSSLEEQGFNRKNLFDAGLVQVYNDHQKNVPTLRVFFQNSVTFPVMEGGYVKYFTSRSMGNSGQKYLHLKGHMPIYNSQVLSFRKDGEKLIVVEGVFDCLALNQAGFRACAISGTAAKPANVELLKRANTDRIYITLDGDDAGREAAKKWGRELGAKARIVELPDGLDPDEYLLKNSPEDFKTLLNSAKDFIDLELDAIPTEIDRVELSMKLAPMMEIIAARAEQERPIWLRKMRDRFKLSADENKAYHKMVNKAAKEKKNKESAQAQPKIQEGGNFSASFKGLVDIVEHQGRTAFFIKECEEKYVIKDQHEQDGIVLLPPPKNLIPWLPPRGEKILSIIQSQKSIPIEKWTRELYDDLISYHKSISALPSEAYYHLVATWVFHTYLMENFQYTPILCFLAPPDTGKTRTARGMISVAHRGIHVETLNEAVLFRFSQDYGASVFFDVVDICTKAKSRESGDVLLCRFERGAKVHRVQYPDKGAFRDMVSYNVFGPTLIASNEPLDEILATRSIVVIMANAEKKFDNNVTPEGALDLKERLVAFRACFLGKPLPDITKPFPARKGDIYKPLIQVANLINPDIERQIMEAHDDMDGYQREGKSRSLEGQIVQVISDLEFQVEGGVLPVKEITDQLNKRRDSRDQVKYQQVGYTLTFMKFKKKRITGGVAAILYDKELINLLKKKFAID